MFAARTTLTRSIAAASSVAASVSTRTALRTASRPSLAAAPAAVVPSARRMYHEKDKCLFSPSRCLGGFWSNPPQSDTPCTPTLISPHFWPSTPSNYIASCSSASQLSFANIFFSCSPLIDHYSRPRNVGSLDRKDPSVGSGLVGAPACGDVMKLDIRVDPVTNKIVEAKFKTFGCGSAIASSSYLTTLVHGKTLDDAVAIKNSDIASELCLPPVKSMSFFSRSFSRSFPLTILLSFF